MYFENILDFAMTIHHPLAIYGLYIPLYENVSGNFAMMAIFISEISNPAMHLRHMLRIRGKKYTLAYEICEILFIFLYIYGRLVTGIPIIFRLMICEQNHIVFKLTCIGLTF